MAAEVENQPLDEHRAEHVAEPDNQPHAEPGVPDPVLAAGLQLRPVAEPESSGRIHGSGIGDEVDADAHSLRFDQGPVLPEHSNGFDPEVGALNRD